MYKLKLSILLNLMFILKFAISVQGCKGKCEENVLKFENKTLSSKKFSTIGTEHNTSSPENTEKENLKTQNNKVSFKAVKFIKHKNLLHNLPKLAKNHVQNVEKELLMATEKLKALFKPIRIHTKKPTRNFITLQRKKRTPQEEIVDLNDNLRYGQSFDTSFDNKYGHKFDLLPTGRLFTQGFVNKSRNGNEKEYITRKGHKLSSSPEEPSKHEEWNTRKGRDSGYDSNGSQGYTNQYFLNPAAAQIPINNIPPYRQYRTVSDVANNPLSHQLNNLAQPYDRLVPLSDPRLIGLLQGNAAQFGYNALPGNVPFNLPLQSAFVQPNYNPYFPTIF